MDRKRKLVLWTAGGRCVCCGARRPAPGAIRQDGHLPGCPVALSLRGEFCIPYTEACFDDLERRKVVVDREERHSMPDGSVRNDLYDLGVFVGTRERGRSVWRGRKVRADLDGARWRIAWSRPLTGSERAALRAGYRRARRPEKSGKGR